MIAGMMNTCAMYMRAKKSCFPGKGAPQIRFAMFWPKNGIETATP